MRWNAMFITTVSVIYLIAAVYFFFTTIAHGLKVYI